MIGDVLVSKTEDDQITVARVDFVKQTYEAIKIGDYLSYHGPTITVCQILPHSRLLYIDGSELGVLNFSREVAMQNIFTTLGDEFAFAQMQPDGRIIAGTKSGKVLIYDGEPVKK